MQVGSSVSNRYYTPYQTNTSVKYCAGFTKTEDGRMSPNETTENPGFVEFVDYQEFHKAWMSQGAETAFSYTKNNGFNAEANSISLVPGMSVRLSNGFRLAIGDYMVQALGDFKDNQAASESAAIAGALSHLIKVANGQIPMNMFYSKNQDNSAYAKIGLQAFGIDTSRPFTINEKTFHFDSDGQIRLGQGQYVSEELETSIVSDETEVYTAKQTGAVSIAETEDEGEFLGITMVPEEGQSVTYGMRAMLSVQSTPDNPIVQVVSNLGGKKVIYNVEVNKVNPNHATQLEMFALLSYTDKMGITDGGTFGSHQQLEVYGGNASSIGYCGSLSGADVFLNERFDWTSIMERMVQVYKDAGIENQAEDCKALFDFFATYKEKDEVKENTAIDFSRFAPNAPEEVRKAFREAAEETGYYEYSGKGKMNYISQILVRQVENRQNGVKNYTDVFGSSVASALQAAREILYDLENPLMPVSQRGENAAKYVEQEKEFYRAFITKLEGMSDTRNVLFSKERMESPFLEDRISVQYAAASTKENPVVKVSMQIGGETITKEINISEVNPRKATQLEMYAFFYHQDMVTGEQNTYQKFTSYVENAVQNGHFEGNQNYNDFTEKEHDWQKVIISMWEDYSDAGIYSQMQECIKLNEAMEKASIQFVDFDNITLVNKSSEVFFTYPGMNVPEQLQVAWMEIAGAMENTERYSHLTQVLNRRIEAELEGKDLQDETGVIDAAIEAVKKAMQDLENTPTEIIANQPDVQEEMQELKSYYEAFIQKLEALKEGGAETTEAVTEETTEINYREFFAMYMEQIFIKIQNGDTETSYQIGSQSFTEKEWETFLEKFDSIEEAIQELMKEEQARKEAEEAKQENELAGTVSAGNGIPGNHGLETWYQGEKVVWSADDTKYTDPETGISYYVKDGKHPYMTAEDTEKLKELCQETGEPWLKKFAEITGMIQQLDDNATAFVGSNGTLIKSKDGKELFIDTSFLTYDAIMSLFKDLPSNGNYFDSSFWEERIRAAEAENVSAIDDGALLTAETTSCKFETADPDDDDITYITFYTTDGIRCKKLGAEDFEWTLTFENEEQYNKVMEFIGQFPSDWNMRFAAHENFWNDFLNDEIDMEGFMEFINGTNKGVPDYSITVGDSMYIDTDKMQWAKYTNPLGTRLYTAEEMRQMQVEIIAANEAKLTKLTDWDAYEEMYKKNHPEYNGEKICCEYPGGPLYTVKEMAELQYRKMLERMGTTEEREQQKREEWRKQMGYPGY